MKQYIFPAVVYVDEDTGMYVLSMKDMTLIVEGDSVEEVFAATKDALKLYCQSALDIDGEVVTPTSFEDVYKKHSKDICLLVDCNC